MAIAGAPRIITQTASALRVSNETESGFVQQANTGLVNTVFDGEDIFVLEDRIVVRRFDGSITYLQLYDLSLTLLDTYTAPTGLWTFSYNPLDAMFVAYTKGGFTANNVRISLNSDRTFFLAGGAPTGLTSGTTAVPVIRAAASPDGSSIVLLTSNARRFFNRVDSLQYQQIIPDNGDAPGAAGQSSIVEWSRDSHFIFFAVGSTVVVYTKDGATYNHLENIPMPGGRTVHRIALSPDKVFIAFSTIEDVEGLTVYNTYLYKRSGERFLPVGSITDFGATTCWNELGDQLYDATARKAYKRTPNTNSFTELVGFMTNIPAGVQEATTSLHIAFPVGQANFFDDILFGIINGSIPLTGWRIALLGEAYVFDSSATDVGPILGTNEVFGAHWPEGGKDLTNVRFEPYGTQGVYMDADDVSQMIYEGSITARYGIIYSEGDVPLVYIDFQKEIIAELNSKFTLKLGDFGFVLISA